MCNVNYEYDQLVKEFETYGDDIDGFDCEPNEVWYVIVDDEVVAETDCREEAVEITKDLIAEDMSHYGTARRYKIEQAEF